VKRRPYSLIANRVSRAAWAAERATAIETPDVERPRTRGDCLPGGSNELRPCPFISCRHHLYLDVNRENGTVKLNFPDADVDELPESCSLDVAARGGQTLEQVAVPLNLTRERVRQLEGKALWRLRRRGHGSFGPEGE
jgi:hypothetical protein